MTTISYHNHLQRLRPPQPQPVQQRHPNPTHSISVTVTMKTHSVAAYSWMTTSCLRTMTSPLIHWMTILKKAMTRWIKMSSTACSTKTSRLMMTTTMTTLCNKTSTMIQAMKWHWMLIAKKKMMAIYSAMMISMTYLMNRRMKRLMLATMPLLR